MTATAKGRYTVHASTLVMRGGDFVGSCGDPDTFPSLAAAVAAVERFTGRPVEIREVERASYAGSLRNAPTRARRHWTRSLCPGGIGISILEYPAE